MVRLTFCFGVLAAALCLLSDGAAASAQKKKPIDASSFSGKITDVNLDDKKKVESIFVQLGAGARAKRKIARINEKTKIEFLGFKDKSEEQLKAGQMAEVKLDAEANYAATIKVTAAPAPKKKT